jgi:hypothetical protein
LDTKKRGRPTTGHAMTPAQRQQASRARRLAEKFESTSARQVNFLLSARATHALDMLTKIRTKTQKIVVEEVLIETYEAHKNKSYQINDKSLKVNELETKRTKDEAKSKVKTTQFSLDF